MKNIDAKRRSGYALLELMAALTILAVGILGYLSTFFTNSGAIASTRERDDVRIALENVAERLRNTDLQTLLADFDGTTVPAPPLKGPNSAPATVQITCFVNELALPPEFGPVQDLDGSGSLDSTNCSTTSARV